MPSSRAPATRTLPPGGGQGGDLAQPHRVQLAGLRPSRQVPAVLGVYQPCPGPGRLEQAGHGLLVIRGGLHDDPGHARNGHPARDIKGLEDR